MLVDSIEERLATLQSQWHKTGVKTLHVMRTIHVVVHDASAGRSKGFDRVEFVLLHSGRLATSDYRHCFPGVYTIRRDRVTIQVSNRFHL